MGSMAEWLVHILALSYSKKCLYTETADTAWLLVYACVSDRWKKKDGGKKDSSQFQAESTQAGGEMFVHDCRGDTHHTVSLVQFPFQQLFLTCTETFSYLFHSGTKSD